MSRHDPSPRILLPQPGLADKLAMLKAEIALHVTDEFFARHPDWLTRYGQRGHVRGVEDACFHIDFLAGALESQSIAAFEDYVRWTTRVLAARGIDPQFVAENLHQIAAALDSKLTADEQDAVSLVLMAGCAVCDRVPRADQAPTAPDAIDDPLRTSQALFLRTILKGQRAQALQIALEALRAGYSVLDTYTRIFQESLYQVGQLWETNTITVAEEHMATAITQHVIAQLYPHLPPSQQARGRVVLTGAQGELHQVGAAMVADVLEADGWDVRYLGSNMPHAGILAAIESHGADILGISTTMLFNVPRARALIAEVHAHFGSRRPRIVVGGRAFQGLTAIGATLGADGLASDLHGASAIMEAALRETTAS